MTPQKEPAYKRRLIQPYWLFVLGGTKANGGTVADLYADEKGVRVRIGNHDDPEGQIEVPVTDEQVRRLAVDLAGLLLREERNRLQARGRR